MTNRDRQDEMWTTSRLVAFYFMAVTIAGENVAFNKPTDQRATQYGAVSSRGVDGVYNDGCTFTGDNGGSVLDYMWWAVDLGAVYDISHVVISKHPVTGPHFLDDVHVELYMTSFTACSPRANKCAYYGPELPMGVNLTCSPNTIGRFLVVRHSTVKMLCLCEVEAYGTLVNTPDEKTCSTNMKITREEGYKVDGSVDIVQGSATTRMSCSAECMETGQCAVYSYNSDLNQCVYALADLQNTIAVASPGWDTYRVCY